MSTGPNWPLTIFILLVVILGVVWFIRLLVVGVRAYETAEAKAKATDAAAPRHPAPDRTVSQPSADIEEDLPVKLEQVRLSDRERVDLRSLPTVRMVIRGAGNWIGYGVRDTARFDSTEYALLREPSNRHDIKAIAIHHPNGRKVGYVSRTRAEGMAPLLDGIGSAAFIVAGGLDDGRLRVDLPSLPALRTFAKRAGRSAS